ncbi:dTMP kinase [Candidatus Curtissbacteria bacterium]|nr:dTMP kinase [Candidatus Curtissbacteria bacterium]
MAKKGKFVVFEGIDGAGSTTQLLLLHNYLKKKKIPVVKTAEPTSGPIGKRIRGILQGKEKIDAKEFQLLYCQDREEHLKKQIIPALASGKTVLCDRYYFSTIAYGSLKLDYKWLVSICAGFLRPDVTFLVNTPAKVAMERMKSRREKELFEKEKLLEKVGKAYLKLMKTDKSCFILTGTKSKQEIFTDVLKVLKYDK